MALYVVGLVIVDMLVCFNSGKMIFYSMSISNDDGDFHYSFSIQLLLAKVIITINSNLKYHSTSQKKSQGKIEFKIQ